jgi:hypothetical protein
MSAFHPESAAFFEQEAGTKMSPAIKKTRSVPLIGFKAFVRNIVEPPKRCFSALNG